MRLDISYLGEKELIIKNQEKDIFYCSNQLDKSALKKENNYILLVANIDEANIINQYKSRLLKQL